MRWEWALFTGKLPQMFHAALKFVPVNRPILRWPAVCPTGGDGGCLLFYLLKRGSFLLPSEEKETELLRRVVDAGGVDGCTRERTMTVDHLALDVHLSVLRAVTELTKRTMGETIPEPFLFITGTGHGGTPSFFAAVSAASIVCIARTEAVTEPTPPGTGFTLIPTSRTVWPGFTIFPVTRQDFRVRSDRPHPEVLLYLYQIPYSSALA